MKKIGKILMVFVITISSILPSYFTVNAQSNVNKGSSKTTVNVTTTNASNSQAGTLETLIKFNGEVNKDDVITLTYTAEEPYNEEIFQKFIDSIIFNDSTNIFTHEKSIVDNKLTITLTPKYDGLDSPNMSIGFSRETYHNNLDKENCEFNINNSYTYKNITHDTDTILINSIYVDPNVPIPVYTGIDGPNSPLADKTCIGFEDLAKNLTNNTLFNDPFIYIRNSQEGIFIPQYVIRYDLIDPKYVPEKIRVTFKTEGPGKIEWDNIHLYSLNRTNGNENTKKITLTEENGSYFYEIDTGNLIGNTKEELFAFGMKVDNLDFDNPTTLFYHAELFDENGSIIYSNKDKPVMNAITYATSTGTGWLPNLNIRDDFSILIGEEPDYRLDLYAFDPQPDGSKKDITSKVQIDDSKVDLTTAGKYPVIYTVSDDDGNVVTKSLTLTVIDSRITINYIDEESGSILQSTVLDSKKSGTYFSVDSPSITDYTIVDPDQSVVKGSYTNEPQIINVPYKKHEGKVIIKYVDEDGNEIEDSDSISGLIGSYYKTTPIKINGYMVTETPSNFEGTYTEEDIIVTYVYKAIVPNPPIQNDGNVIIKYVDEDGNEIKARDSISGPIGSKYQTVPALIGGYTLKETPDNYKGTYTEEDIIVTYVYSPNGVVPPTQDSGKVIIKYVDEDGNEIKARDSISGPIGSNYQTVPALIKGFTLKETPDNYKGTYTKEDIIVTYVYSLNGVVPPTQDNGKVIIRYVDEKGNNIIPSRSMVGPINSPYQTFPALINGYVLKEIPDNDIGVYTVEDIIVTYVYSPIVPNPPIQINGKVIIKYVDENGNEIKDHDTMSGPIESTYQTYPALISGYTLKEIPINDKGLYTIEDIIVTYIYSQILTEQPSDTPNNHQYDKINIIKRPIYNNKISNKEKSLPKTGERLGNPSVLLIFLMIISLTFYLFVYSSKRDNK